MKKIKLSLFVFAIVIITASINVYSLKKHTFSELAICNIEALANNEYPWDYPWEDNSGKGKIAKKETCMYVAPNGYFSSSIERVCYDQYVCPSCTCTPVKCGDFFID